MQEFILYFQSDKDSIILHKTIFNDSSNKQNLICMHGNSLIRPGYGSFSWSNAVRAISVLFLKYAAQDVLNTYSEFLLEGNQGSPASSLDYALSKLPCWILDMFGIDSNGQSVLRDIIQRSNPERKNPGPVKLAISPSTRRFLMVKVLCNDLPVDNAAQLIELSDKIVFSKKDSANTNQETILIEKSGISKLDIVEKDKSKLNCSIPGTMVPDAWTIMTDILTPLYKKEIFEMLHISLCRRYHLKQAIEGINNNAYFKKLVEKNNVWEHLFDFKLEEHEHLGMLKDWDIIRKEFATKGPIKIAVPAVLAAPLAVFVYLKQYHHLNIEIDYFFPNDTSLVRKLLLEGESNASYDAFVVSVANAGFIESCRLLDNYHPALFLPKERYRIVGYAQGEPRSLMTSLLRCVFDNDHVSTQAFYYNQIIDSYTNKNNVSTIINADSSDIYSMLQNDITGLSAILCFPQYNLHESFYPLQYLDDPSAGLIDNFLCVRSKLLSDDRFIRLFATAIRNASLSLLEKPKALDGAVDTLMNDEIYLRLLSRTCGIPLEDFTDNKISIRKLEQ